MGNVDYYDYVGYERNKQFILLKDYIDNLDDSLIETVRNRKAALIGDLYLCRRLLAYFRQNDIAVIRCLGMLPQDDEFQELLESQMDDTDKDTTWLIIVPDDRNAIWKKEKELTKKYCEEKEINDYADCFSYVEVYIDIESKNFPMREFLRPKRIVLGAIEEACGNVFLRGLLDDHPSIMLYGFGSMSNNLFWICASLSGADAEDILPLLWNAYGTMLGIEFNDENNKRKFNEKMEQLLNCVWERREITSQELFVMFHTAYMYMLGKNIAESDIKNMVIYWEPHYMDRRFVEECSKWLNNGKGSISCSIVNVVRNLCAAMGSRIKNASRSNLQVTRLSVPIHQPIHNKNYNGADRLVVRFEDLKCNPKETLLSICDKWDIPWSESLMRTTSHGEKMVYYNGEYEVDDFDLRPVYETYEKYFSEFDRLRIMIINAPWQRKYGYPYVGSASFSRRELQEMFLMQFRFEDSPESYGDKELEKRMQQNIRVWLQEARMQEMYY